MSANKYRIRKVAVLGSGVMGSQIAAHCINAGLEVLLLDLKSDNPKQPNKIAEESVKKITKMVPAPFALPEFAHRIEVGNFEDDFEKLSNCDWICEVVIERMDIKRQLMEKIEAVRNPFCVVSSNTSGLPIGEISEGRGEDFKKHFLGTHFFNPPRYMKLLEVIPTGSTDSEVLKAMHSFGERVLGKGVVLCKDTPNFIGNRIGVFSICSIIKWFFEGKLRIEEIDLLTGTLTGYSKTAQFRTADIVGLDVLNHVASNLIPAIPDDEMKEVFKLSPSFKKMVEAGVTGNKSGSGFYKKIRTQKGTEFQVYNLESGDYEPQVSNNNEVITEAKSFKKSAERLKFLSSHDSETGKFIWETQRDLMLYAANRVPKITDSPEAIDRAMKWGFNWELGPFERWDALGLKEVAERVQSEGGEVPELIKTMLNKGISSFYDGDKTYDPVSGAMIDRSPYAKGELKVAAIRSKRVPVLENDSAALHDMGDKVALFEFKTKNATLGFELVQSLEKGLKTVERYFKALVISHDGDNFAYGANLMEAGQASFGQVEEAVINFQRTAIKLRYAPFPVVIAPFGRTLGGGVEFALYSDLIVAHHELYMGLVEVGVGLIPAGGGTTEMLRRAMAKVEEGADPLPFIREVFKTIGMAKVSDSAHKARELGFLREKDIIVMNRDLQLSIAKQEALKMADAGYEPPAKLPLEVLGQKSLSVMKTMLYIMSEGGFATEYDKVVGERVGRVIAGGDLSEPQKVPEEYLLKMETDAILECFKDQRTHARIEHMLNTGKPLRN